ncbi:MAG: hypothetical protein HN368_22590, partial [Spirochaetales bacterium]|nr:hypothetical protein [Spirochaetales bacterium]
RDSFDEWIFLYNSIDAAGFTDLSAALSDNDVSALLSNLPTSRKIIILDACNSGGFIGSQLEIDVIPQDTYISATDDGSLIREGFFDAISRYVTVPGGTKSDLPSIDALVITAAGEAEESYEASLYGHGVFTYHLLNAQTYGDSNDDGFITVGECFGYTEAMIAGWWDNPIYSFTPRISGGPVDFVLFESN